MQLHKETSVFKVWGSFPKLFQHINNVKCQVSWDFFVNQEKVIIV